MEISQAIGYDRVRLNTPGRINRCNNEKIEDNIRYFSKADVMTLKARIDELNKEWDVEQALKLNASIISFAGIILGATVHKRWLFLPVIASAFLAQHAIKGWCPPLEYLRSKGIRTQKEIEVERRALINILENKMGMCLLK